MIEVSGQLNEQYTVDNKARSHRWISDEPLEAEGHDLGPKPTELLLSALISCKIITIKMYANRKGWDVKDVQITLRMGERAERTVVEKSIAIDGDLDETQTQRLIAISARCPVAKMLENSIEIKLVD